MTVGKIGWLINLIPTGYCPKQWQVASRLLRSRKADEPHPHLLLAFLTYVSPITNSLPSPWGTSNAIFILLQSSMS